MGHEKITGVGGDGIEFWGQSFVAGTSGEILSKASSNQEEILVVPVDLDQVDVKRTISGNADLGTQVNLKPRAEPSS